MKRLAAKFFSTSFVWFLGFAFFSQASLAEKGPITALLVDKKTNTLTVSEYVKGEYKTIKKYHATLGKVKGDKEEEKDLKTPEGIYTFNAYLTPPHIKPKFGKMAFYVDYPNSFDKLAGRTGYDIMLHATNEPDRLKQNYDSEGCIVLRNEDITEVKPYIRLGLTPIIIFPELTDEFLHPGKNAKLVEFFNSWVKAWETKSLDGYVDHYHSDFSANGKDKKGWKAYKGALNSRYSEIAVNPTDVMFISHPKYWVVTFTQNYWSKLKNGGTGHRSHGTKILYIAEESGQPKIIAETFSNLMW
ncbi:L,D-transpeptidase family protein [bacterium]|jgi:murein L,D-transpeptidase YafK|nr:L,D-transpeptidase family protein [bacterium]